MRILRRIEAALRRWLRLPPRYYEISVDGIEPFLGRVDEATVRLWAKQIADDVDRQIRLGMIASRLKEDGNDFGETP